jgi:ParB/RepB/Spo0J family partition protein
MPTSQLTTPPILDPLPAARPVELPPDEIVIIEGRNDRRTFDDEPMLALGESMRTGQLQEIIVNETYNGYELVAGERRLRAALEADRKLIGCKVYRDLTPAQILWIVSDENTQVPLNVLERATSFEKEFRLGFGVEQIAARRHCGADTVRRLLTITELPDEVQALMIRKAHPLPIHQACRIAKMPEGQMLAMAKRVAPAGGPVASDEQLRAWIDETLGKPLPGMEAVADDPPAAEGEEAWEDTRAGTDPVIAEAAAPPASSLQPPPSDNAWKATHVRKLGLPAKVVEALESAGLWCAGLVATFQQTHGIHWTQEITGIGEAAQQAVEDAFERLWAPQIQAQAPAAGADDNDVDQPNAKRLARVNEAPIKGTVGQTQRDREAQARADSDRAAAAAAAAAKPRISVRAPLVAAKISATGKIGFDSKGQAYIEISNSKDLLLKLKGMAVKLAAATLTLTLSDVEAKRVAAAYDAAIRHSPPKKRPVHNGGKRRK